MEYKFAVEGRLPGLNEYTSANRTNPYKGAKMKAESEDTVIQAIRKQLGRVHITSPVMVHYRWIEQNRRRDLDNISSFGRKVIQDSLVKAHVLDNDGWDNIKGFTDSFAVDKGCPRIEVEIVEVGKE